MTATVAQGETQNRTHEWLQPETWPVPKWYSSRTGTDAIPNYESYFTNQLRTRYLELENDFRSIFGNFYNSGIADRVTAGRIVDILHEARKALESEKPNLIAISSMLDLVERYMIWISPPQVLTARAVGLFSQVQHLDLPDKDHIVKEFASFLGKDEKELFADQYTLGHMRGFLDEVIYAINRHRIQSQISNGLQIERLRLLRFWGCFVLAALLAVSPLTTNLTALNGWPAQAIIDAPVLVISWLNALGIVMIGAVGGFISGLLQARSTKVTLIEYQENMLKIQLKPLVGSLLSLILYILVSWQIIPGITIQNVGSYFIIAFLSGFSERYFLKLLEIKNDQEDADKRTEITNTT